ncbi:alpha/beta hydrolase [Rhodococcoides fascians A21d2]|uniref:alpha/beta fold hydrolase n=1 Tax=Nocardiaceae TaxID=85025 RepID=UPI000561DB6A|nr:MULTISPECIES: alpha/beta hydrolase [Rhodococcus]OZC48780.1 alpha/beta hydrolase [Rhodococcus sp. WWJCD1]OZE81215.1 alpha/beta hydrolase [Rhodococcus sp. 15-649-2-2]QIH98596.1 alpha/beta hydrolase [Rhodococcus fascians A21d2]
MNARTRNNVRVVGAPDGPVLMLAHGVGCDQTLWRSLTTILAADFRIVLFDHVGAGASDPSAWNADDYSTLDAYARDIAAIADELELDDITFVGHSVSAMMGVLAADAAPERFSKLVMLVPSPRYIDDGDYRGGFSREDIDELLDSLDSNYLGWSASMAPVVVNAPDRPELEAEWIDSFCRTDPARVRLFARTTFLSDNRADLATVTVPTLIVDCARDSLAPPQVGRYVNEHIAGSTLTTLDASGHCPHVTVPEQTAEAIATFVRSS